MGPDPALGDHAVAPQNPRRKRRREDSRPAPPSPEFRILAAKWQYRMPTTAPPAGAAEGQGQSEAPRPAPAPEPSAPEPGPADTVEETGPTDAAAEVGPADAAAEKGPTDAVAETETQPPSERSTPSEPAPSAPSPGRMTVRQFSGTQSQPEEARRGPSA
ncbi:predicted GPI-anchored protein 58 [Phragmites australis]|uniref:predicted GPI-anchored protein 58 n=1 Tax=Phragmites australis TaxID=29695 RepID=UPI002D79432B|nr:predicted GPI-anchored protein 58 [Phragmites australis]